MTKRKTSDPKKRRPASQAARAAEAAAAQDDSNWLSPAAVRETIESVIIAFVLAFLFRTFEAEAFVIPTGSMAPTLMGKHKDVECPMCHYRYQANASDRSDGQRSSPPVVSTTCPMCRYTLNVSPENPQREDYDSYDGDRILVAKFPYEFDDPKPWDVVVFKYPGDATMNYIKRLVGLPGDTIRIHNGDLWIRRPKPGPGYPRSGSAGDFEIARKPPPKILAMLQPVYDNDLAPTISGKSQLNWPKRWTPDEMTGDYLWTEGDDLSCFVTKGSGNGEAWVRYHHRVPDGNQWHDALQPAVKELKNATDPGKSFDLLKSHLAPPENVPPQLISDFTAYNTSVVENAIPPPPNGLHWVGDLAVQFELNSHSATGKVNAELVKGGRHFRCGFDLASGTAALTISGEEPEAKAFHPTAATPVKGAGTSYHHFLQRRRPVAALG